MKPLPIRQALAFLIALISLELDARGQEISAANKSRLIRSGLWEWTIYIQGPAEILERVSCVVYTLHPTFENPERRACAKDSDQTPFPLTASGWGEFRVDIKVEMRDGGLIRLKHDLVFLAPAAPADFPVSLTNDAKKIGKSLWEWRAFLKGPDEALGKVRCVEYTLHPTFPDQIRESCSRDNPDRPFSITATGWGVFELKARVILEDGSVKDLRHMLKF